MRTGLDYTAVRAAHEMAGGEWSAELFERLRVAEGAAIDAWSSGASESRR